MLLKAIKKEIESTFPSLEFITNEKKGLIAIPPKDKDIGFIEIQDDTNEATVFIGNFTHSHFGCYEENFTAGQKTNYIVAEVMTFLNDMFNDQVVMWGSHTKGGGYYLKGNKSNSKTLLGKQHEEWVWSGPLHS